VGFLTRALQWGYETFKSQKPKVVLLVLSMPVLVVALIVGMAFLVFVSHAILDRLEDLRVNR